MFQILMIITDTIDIIMDIIITMNSKEVVLTQLEVQLQVVQQQEQQQQ
jgi:hypothetical protein